MKTIKISMYDYDQDYDDIDMHDDRDVIPSSPYSSRVELYDEKTGVKINPSVLVNFSVEAIELEGNGVPSPYTGGIIINNVVLEEDVSIGGKIFPAGTDARVLQPFLEYNLDKHFIDELEYRGVDIPRKRYPETR